MADELLALTEQHLDIIKEVSNVGAGNGATALAQLLKRKISMSVPRVHVSNISDVTKVLDEEEEQVVALYLRVEGVAPANMLFQMSLKDAYSLIDMMLNRSIGYTKELDRFNQSVIEEMANIVAGSFLAALYDFTKISFNPSPPALAVDMAGALLNTVLLHYGFEGDTALMIDTEFKEQDRLLNGKFFLLPDPGSLEKILNALGVSCG